MLIAKLIDEDQEAFVYMIRVYNKLLWAIVGSILGSVGTAQDIEECISDVYIQIWKNPMAFNRQKGSFKTFLAVIARSRALNAYKKLAKSKTVELDEEITTHGNDLTDYIAEQEAYAEIYAAIATLKEPNKEILVRRYFLEQKPAQIAEHISIPVKEVENRLYQSKTKLRKILGKIGGVWNGE